MATVTGNLSNGFYSAFYEPDATKRREALNRWVKSATPVIQAAVSDELEAFIISITQGRWIGEGWKEGNEKLHRIQNDYPLVMDISLRRLGSEEKYIGKLPDRVEHKPPTPVKSSVVETTSKTTTTNIVSDDDGEDDDNGGRSPNDDRSDSMNPNNDDYQASTDNHSDQMNPNNDAYWSSRGH